VLAVGQQTLKTTFTPTDTTDYTTSTASVTLTVLPATPAVTLTALPNPAFLSNPVAFTATVSSSGITPTGTVAFYDGTTQIGSGTLAGGIATYTTSALTTGVHSITAAYSGDASYLTGTSGALPESIEDFTLTMSGGGTSESAAAITGGQAATYPLVITPVGGATLPGAVSLSVTGLPPEATGTFTPATVAANAGTTNVPLLVMMPGISAVTPARRPFGGSSLPVALGLILLIPFAGRLRKAADGWRRLAVLALMSAALVVGLNGCGVTATPQSYQLTVTATSGSLSHSIALKLTVQ
jgi:hypothetical protein